MDINSVPTPAAVSDAANSSTGYFALPAGTTAQRPGSPATGYTRMNTTTGSVEFYDGANWIATNLIPTINSISGTIYAGVASTLTLSLANATDTIDVKYYEGGTLLATDSGVTVTSGSATSTVPSAVYGQTAGDTISISIFNVDGTPSSNSISKTVQGLPTGGTITTSSGYRIHTFTSSSSLVVPSGMTLSDVEYLVVAGGGGGGAHSGGGAGGYRCSVVGETSGGSSSAEGRLSLSAGSYTVTVGAGGSVGDPGVTGSNSVFNSITSNGGGYGHRYGGGSGGSGGGGGGAGSNHSGGSGTTGQGYSGGVGRVAPSVDGGGGGGGAGAAGASATISGNYAYGGNGGSGITSSITGSAVTRAGGGGGYGEDPGSGGAGGGGRGKEQNPPVNGTAGAANTGSGGGGGGGGSPGNGGSGIVIVRYQL